MDDLGDRMKEYERRETGQKFMPLLPVYARIDGRGFSKFTQGLQRPYDQRFRDVMRKTTEALVNHTHAKIGYTQSDEISLCWMADANGSIFFDGKKQKMVSQLSALATAFFTKFLLEHPDPDFRAYAKKTPTFDARVFELPNTMECANAFLWREKDATKNALSMAARCYYSHKELMNKNSSDMNEMLFQKGVNFNDYPSEFKRGVFVRKETVDRELTPAELARIPDEHKPATGQLFTRNVMVSLDMPIFSHVQNRVEVMFEGAQPVVAEAVKPKGP